MAAAVLSRGLATAASASRRNVAVLGAAGGIGQPLSLLFKTSDLVDNLHLYDVVNVPGVAADLSHISTPVKVKGFPKDQLADALKGTDVVVIPAGVPRKPGMTRDDLFNTNATIVKTLAEAVAKYGPRTLLSVSGCSPGARRAASQARAQGPGADHFQPGQLDRAHRRRDVQEGRCVRSAPVRAVPLSPGLCLCALMIQCGLAGCLA
jgi:nucleoside-diphosphate-sugar epimerase